ncbi:MAG TPA: hypothetical protein VGR53_09815 [Nitrososphaerales archaeon]|nr:hypothetical protein [Nitrososphaerales archaeon]
MILLYSVAIMATALPGFGRIPNTIVLPYYVIFPGYAFSLVLRQSEGIIQTVFYSLVWSLAIVGSFYSLATVTPTLAKIPLSGFISTLTLVLTIYAYYHGR